MNGIAASLTDQDMADIAAYYAAQPVPAPESSGGDTALAMDLITKGHGSRMVPTCAGCLGKIFISTQDGGGQCLIAHPVVKWIAWLGIVKRLS